MCTSYIDVLKFPNVNQQDVWMKKINTLRHTDIKGHDHCYRALWQFGCAVKKGIKHTTDSLLLENKLFIDAKVYHIYKIFNRF